jgi:hypothetical protein
MGYTEVGQTHYWKWRLARADGGHSPLAGVKSWSNGNENPMKVTVGDISAFSFLPAGSPGAGNGCKIRRGI